MTGLVTPEEINRVRLYKQNARSTVLVASAYVSVHHIVEAPGKCRASEVLKDDHELIVTNAHVVLGTVKISAKVHDEMRLPMTLIGSARQADIALLM